MRAEHVWAAIQGAAPGPVAEGAVGAGTGTRCFGWKGGIGTASRVLPSEAGGFSLGALVQSNFGHPLDLAVAGVPIGCHIQPPDGPKPEARDQGSIMIILATDAPLTARQLWRLCVRAAAGLARTGSTYDHASGDFAIAFSTAYRIEHEPERLTALQATIADEARVMDGLFRAVVESVEEAILNSLCQAKTIVGRDDNVAHALAVDEVAALVRRYRQAASAS